jgi:hypothetical protein
MPGHLNCPIKHIKGINVNILPFSVGWGNLLKCTVRKIN